MTTEGEPRPHQIGMTGPLHGITVIRSDILENNTIICSPDVYEAITRACGQQEDLPYTRHPATTTAARDNLPPLGLRVKVTRRLGDSLIARRDFKHDAVFRDPKVPHWLNDDDKFVDIAMNPVVKWEYLPLEGEPR